jgi:hypothetical protein
VSPHVVDVEPNRWASPSTNHINASVRMIEPAISGGGKELGCGPLEQPLREAAERSGFEIVKSTATTGSAALRRGKRHRLLAL